MSIHFSPWQKVDVKRSCGAPDQNRMIAKIAITKRRGKGEHTGMIRNIIFDMGGVLIQFDREYFIRRLGVAPEDERMLMNEVFRSLEWAQLDRGTITQESAIANICARLPQRLHEAASSLVTSWDRPIIPIEGMYELVEELKNRGYGIYLLSNATVRLHEYWPNIAASRFFDGKLVSADVKLVKPQPELYILLCDTFGLVPSECFMIDDMPQNIEGAYEAHLAGFVFNDDVTALRNALKQAGVHLA